MVRGPWVLDPGGVARIIMFWVRPNHLSEAEAGAWVHAQVGRLAAGVPGIARAELTPLRRATERHAAPADWMLELHVAPGADRRACLEAEPCRSWLADLWLLGMRPMAVVADGGTVLGGEG